MNQNELNCFEIQTRNPTNALASTILDISCIFKRPCFAKKEGNQPLIMIRQYYVSILQQLGLTYFSSMTNVQWVRGFSQSTVLVSLIFYPILIWQQLSINQLKNCKPHIKVIPYSSQIIQETQISLFFVQFCQKNSFNNQDFMYRTRDGNSSENFTPRGIEESRNGNLTFFEDRGRQTLFLGVLEEFRGPKYGYNRYKKSQAFLLSFFHCCLDSSFTPNKVVLYNEISFCMFLGHNYSIIQHSITKIGLI